MAAGNQVFQVVVENDDIATHISSLLCREKVGPRPNDAPGALQDAVSVNRLATHAGSTCRGLWSLLCCNVTSSIAHHTKFTADSGAQAGRVTFCPLNRIAPEAVRYPGDLGTDAQPLIARLEFDARFQKAVQQARHRRCRPSILHADLLLGVPVSQPEPVSPARFCFIPEVHGALTARCPARSNASVARVSAGPGRRAAMCSGLRGVRCGSTWGRSLQHARELAACIRTRCMPFSGPSAARARPRGADLSEPYGRCSARCWSARTWTWPGRRRTRPT